MALCTSFSRLPKFATARRISIPSVVAPQLRKGIRVSASIDLLAAFLLQPSLKLRKKLTTKAEGDGASAPDVDAIVKDLTDKWEKVENKSQVAIYGVGVIAALYITSSIISAVNAIPFVR